MKTYNSHDNFDGPLSHLATLATAGITIWYRILYAIARWAAHYGSR